MAGVRHAQVGSLPGTDFAAAARFALAETPDPSHLPELPARGAPAQLVGRATALAPGLAFDLQPAGWRLTGGALGVGDSADARRARALLRDDLDRFEEAAQGFVGPVTVSAAGPLTLAANVELPRGDKVLADPGARRDLGQALTEGLRGLVDELRGRLPDIEWSLQLDEPQAGAVLAGSVPTASGYDRHRPLPAPQAAQEYAELARALAGVPLGLHSCAAEFPWELSADLDSVSLDGERLGTRDRDEIARWLESGRELRLGVVPTTTPGRVPGVDEVIGRTLSVLRPLELGEAAVQNLVLTPACGLAGWSAADAHRVLRTLRDATEPVAEQLTR
ncbi:methionine synthase [Naumannella cuiyingiana]|nr:methionine synthase [Naumannella cuiyingiana]